MDPNKNYKTLFNVFHQFLNFCEGDTEEANVETMFHCAKTIENICTELEHVDAIESFDVKLKEFLELNGLKCLPMRFFKRASHHLLSQYMVNSKFSESEVIRAVDLFISNKSEGEFHELAQQMANTNQTVEALRKSLCSSGNIGSYEAERCREELEKMLINNKGDVEEIYEEVTKSVLDNCSMCRVFLDVICLPSDREITDSISEVVALSLINLLKDCDNSNLYCQLVDLSEQDLHCIITKWPSFVEALLQAVRVSVGRLRCNYSGTTYAWTTAGTDPCLGFDQIITLISRCKNVPGVNSKLKEFLQQIGEEGFGILAEDIMHKCHIR